MRESSINDDNQNQEIRKQLRLYMQHQSPNILRRLFQALEGVPPSAVREYIYDIFIAVMDSFPGNVRDWFTEILQWVKESILTQTEKQRFIVICQRVFEVREDEDEMMTLLQLIGRRYKKEQQRVQK